MRVALVPLNKRLVFPDGHVEEGFRVTFEERTMTKGEKLMIWDLFMKFREVLPPTPENTRWAHEWAAVFHEMEHHDEPAPAPSEATTAADHDDELEAEPDAPDQDPHEHGVPNRGGAGSGRRKKK